MSSDCWNGRVGRAASCRRRLTTSHSRIIGRPRRFSLPQLVLPARRERSERTGFPSNAKGRDVEPPSFESTQRSKEGAKNDAPPARSDGIPDAEDNAFPDRSGGILAAEERRVSRQERRHSCRLGAAPFRRRAGGARGGRSPPFALPASRTPSANRKRGARNDAPSKG